jgi:hypothetical protein
MAEKKKHHPFSHTVVEHHSDGSSTVHHIHEKHEHEQHIPTRDGDVKHAAADLDSLHDSMQDHLGTPNPGEQEADAGVHGVAPEQAASAGLPAPVAGAVAPPMGA